MDGIRIVELSVALTGPLAVAMLVDQGADAIKIEQPGLGDQGRYIGVSSGGVSALFQICNRGKRAIAVDCGDPRGNEIVLDLAAGADVFVQNMRPGVADRLGVGYQAVSERRPDIVYTSISGFGPDGPYAHRRAYDSVLQAQAGVVANQTGANDDSPAFLRQAIADKVTAYTACQAITAALFARERGAGGQHITVAMLDSMVAFMYPDAAGHEVALDNDQPHLDQSASARQKAIAFSDGHAVVTPITDAQFHGLASTFGVDSSDPLVATIDLRFANREAMSAVLREVHAAAARLTLAEGVERLEQADVPYGVVLALEQVVDDAQVRHNQLMIEHRHPQMGRVRQIRPPARFSRTPADLRVASSPAIGQHTDDILREHGWGHRLEELRADGVIE